MAAERESQIKDWIKEGVGVDIIRQRLKHQVDSDLLRHLADLLDRKAEPGSLVFGRLLALHAQFALPEYAGRRPDNYNTNAGNAAYALAKAALLSRAGLPGVKVKVPRDLLARVPVSWLDADSFGQMRQQARDRPMTPSDPGASVRTYQMQWRGMMCIEFTEFLRLDHGIQLPAATDAIKQLRGSKPSREIFYCPAVERIAALSGVIAPEGLMRPRAALPALLALFTLTAPGQMTAVRPDWFSIGKSAKLTCPARGAGLAREVLLDPGLASWMQLELAARALSRPEVRVAGHALQGIVQGWQRPLEELAHLGYLLYRLKEGEADAVRAMNVKAPGAFLLRMQTTPLTPEVVTALQRLTDRFSVTIELTNL